VAGSFYQPLQAVVARGARAVLPHFTTKACRLQRAFDVSCGLVRLNGLFAKWYGAQLHRFNNRVDARVGCQEDDQEILSEFLDLRSMLTPSVSGNR
jgi:hypothetical protein